MRQGVIRLIDRFLMRKRPRLEKKYLDYLYYAYPSNHTYKISGEQLRPFNKLAKRYKKIRAVFPAPLTSLVDIGCSKGFFVFAAGADVYCRRALGIDIHPEDIEVCGWVKRQLEAPRASFAAMQLHELAERITELGGPFQTVLLLNTYQYLYFGSLGHPECYRDHDRIFALLRKICCGRIIFNNRIEFSDCQQQVKQLAGGSTGAAYSRGPLLLAASHYFKVEEHGKVGRYPLFTFDV